VSTKRKTRKSHSGNRKHGRNKIKCERYFREHRKEKNKIKKIAKHLKFHINDKKAQSYLNRFKNAI